MPNKRPKPKLPITSSEQLSKISSTKIITENKSGAKTDTAQFNSLPPKPSRYNSNSEMNEDDKENVGVKLSEEDSDDTLR